ncbi:MAG TPA: glycosyl hydrolase family 18 protein [Acidimicrobiales bacterium]|jgi:spore germination protein YaaH|nr:glycosyl hydrolase family 18 protein [Acidimicrobiales bacterium]
MVREVASRTTPPRHAAQPEPALHVHESAAAPPGTPGFFARNATVVLAFTQAHVVKRAKRKAPVIAASVFCVAMLCFGFLIGTSPSGTSGDTHRSSASNDHRNGRDTSATFSEAGGNALKMLGAGAHIKLAPATAPPTAAPAALVNQPPLAARENFAFAPYWTLPRSSSFSITGLSTIAYFSIDVNANGTLAESGSGWDGFQSQDLANLITRAHGAGERVVLTVTDFDQGSLNAITSSPTAAGTLSSTLIPLLQAKSLDGVNFDFEGEGSGDQVGLTHLITSVAGSLRAADPHWQITMDTYASSAGDSGGFYNLPALAPAVDAFFVMDYELNLQATPTAASPLTSGQFSSQTTLQQYTSAVPASKVILGVPFFGIDWPTNNGTMAAAATGGANDIADSQAAANGPEYWDPVTDTAWTSYQVGSQWHESYYEGLNGLFDVSQMAAHYNARGVGIWALGMESNDAQMIAALDGISPGAPPGTGPQSTSSSPTPGGPGPGTPGSGGQTAVAAPPTTSSNPPVPAPASSGGPAAAAATTTTTTAAPFITAMRTGKTVTLTAVDASQVARLAVDGQVTNFQSNEPAYSCLNGATLNVFTNLKGQPVAVAATPTNCVSQDFLLP